MEQIVQFDQDSEGWADQSLSGFIHTSVRREREGLHWASLIEKEFVFERTAEMMPPWGCADLANAKAANT